jgi:hypothetical protein
MVRVIAMMALVVCSGVAEAGETRSSKSTVASPSLLTMLRDLLGVKPVKTAVRPPARIATAPAKPAVAPRSARVAPPAVSLTTALAPSEPPRGCAGQRVMSAFYSEGVMPGLDENKAP